MNIDEKDSKPGKKEAEVLQWVERGGDPEDDSMDTGNRGGEGGMDVDGLDYRTSISGCPDDHEWESEEYRQTRLAIERAKASISDFEADGDTEEVQRWKEQIR